MAVAPLCGWRKVRVTARRTKHDFAEFLRTLAEEDFLEAEVIVLVMDNLNTHNPGALYDFPPEVARRLVKRFEWHYTPEHGSWLNIAECELSVLAKQCLRRRIPDQETLMRETAAWETRRNQTGAKVDWQFTTDQVRVKLKRLYLVIKMQDSI